MTEQETIAQGVIRREEVPFLSQYGTAYVLYDEQEDTFSYPSRATCTDSASTWVFGRKLVVR